VADDQYEGGENGTYEGDEDLPEVVNLEDAPDAPAREVIPGGLYNGYIDTVEYKRSQKGNAMLECMLRLWKPDGDEATLFYHMTLTGNDIAVGRSKQTLKKLLPDLDFRTFNPHTANELLSGKQIRAKVRVKVNPPNHDYPGPQNQIRDIEPLPEQFLEQ